MTNRTCVIVPSRGRPQNITRLLTAWHDTGATAQLVVALDDDDPQLDTYLDVLADDMRLRELHVIVGPRLRMNGTLNAVAATVLDKVLEPRPGTAPRLPDVIGFMGDDHLPRTPEWDQKIEAALDNLGHGIVYADDLVQRQNLPTAVFMSATIVRALGYMAPPVLVHLFLDNYWRDLGLASGRLRYLPGVVIEHLHPIAGKAEHDETYAQANASETWTHDEEAYHAFVTDGGIIRDAAKIGALG